MRGNGIHPLSILLLCLLAQGLAFAPLVFSSPQDKLAPPTMTKEERLQFALSLLEKKDPKVAGILREKREMMDPRDEDAMRYLLRNAEWFLTHDAPYYQPKEKPKVTIVILHYGNSPEDTLNALKNLAHTTYQNYDIILVDNNSPDRFSERYTSGIAPQIPADVLRRIRLVSNKVNLGYTGGNNQAANMALESGSDYVFYLNNDALIEADSLQKLMDAVKDRPEIGAVQPQIYRYDDSQKGPIAAAIFSTGRLPVNAQQDASDRTKRWIDTMLQTGEARQVADHLYYKEPTMLGAAHLVRSDMLRLSGGFDTRLFMFVDEDDIGYRYAMTGLKKAVLDNTFLAHPPFKSFVQFREQFLLWRNAMFICQKFYHPARGATGRSIAVSKTSSYSFLSLDTRRVRDNLEAYISGQDPLMFIAVFKGIADGLLDHFSPTSEEAAKAFQERELIQYYEEMFCTMTSATDLLRNLFRETDPYRIRLMIFALHQARDKIKFEEHLDPDLREKLKIILWDSVGQWKEWVLSPGRDPVEIAQIREKFVKKVSATLLPVPIFDCAIAWEWEPDRSFVQRLHKVCLEKGLKPYFVHPANLQETIFKLAHNLIAFRLFYDRASDTDPRFLPLVLLAKEKKSVFINEYANTLRAMDKATMHMEFLAKGILVPYTVILPPHDVDSDPSIRLTTLERLGRPFIIKPATGGGGTGVVQGAETLRDIIETRKQYGSDKYLLQKKVEAAFLDSRRAWFRVFYCCTEIFPCWWDDRTHIYAVVSEGDRTRYNLNPLWHIPKVIAQVCQLDFFSTEICLTPQREYITVDYINDPPDMRPKSIYADGVPDIVIGKIADVLSNHILKNRDRGRIAIRTEGPSTDQGMLADNTVGSCP